jgi:hypothetical protein
LQDAVVMLHDAGHGELADDVEETLVGRDICCSTSRKTCQ